MLTMETEAGDAQTFHIAAAPADPFAAPTDIYHQNATANEPSSSNFASQQHDTLCEETVQYKAPGHWDSEPAVPAYLSQIQRYNVGMGFPVAEMELQRLLNCDDLQPSYTLRSMGDVLDATKAACLIWAEIDTNFINALAHVREARELFPDSEQFASSDLDVIRALRKQPPKTDPSLLIHKEEKKKRRLFPFGKKNQDEKEKPERSPRPAEDDSDAHADQPDQAVDDANLSKEDRKKLEKERKKEEKDRKKEEKDRAKEEKAREKKDKPPKEKRGLFSKKKKSPTQGQTEAEQFSATEDATSDPFADKGPALQSGQFA